MTQPYSLSLIALLAGCAAAPVHVRGVRNSNSVAHVQGAGNAVLSTSDDRTDKFTKRICIMPPAQAGLNVQVSTTGKGAVSYSGIEASAEISRGVELATSKLFENNEQTLFVQHTLYRLCEAHANGMLEGVTLKELWQAELHEATVGLEKNAAQIRIAQDQIEASRDLVSALRAKTTDADATKKAELSTQIASIEDKVATLQADLVDLQIRSSDLTKRKNEASKQLPKASTEKMPGAAYGFLFKNVFTTAVELSEVDVRRQRALADRAKSEADKAKSDVEKAKQETEKAKTDLKALERQLIDASVGRAKCDADCDEEDKSKDAKSDKKAP